MVALPTDVARSGKSARRAFETVFQAMVSVLERGSTEKERSAHVTAQATAALCVGGMVVARAMVSRDAADELRGACMAVALKLGGWSKESARRAKSRRRQ